MSLNFEILKSTEDWSVNFISDNNLECRYVRRVPEYFIVYLSSHNGCNKACRFCHLTQTKQTDFEHTTIEEYLEQGLAVLDYYNTIAKNTHGIAKKVNFNFMARGEPLANKYLLANAPLLLSQLDEEAKKLNLETNFNISSIMPEEVLNHNLKDVFKDVEQTHSIYYSLYSLEQQFRKRWLPKAIDPDTALTQLKEWQDVTKQLVVFHWAFIEGENDSTCQINNILDKVNKYGINAKFNLVRYNPYSINQGIESSEEVIQRNFSIIQQHFNHPDSRIVPRVGFDVKASCGMFIDKK